MKVYGRVIPNLKLCTIVCKSVILFLKGDVQSLPRPGTTVELERQSGRVSKTTNLGGSGTRNNVVETSVCHRETRSKFKVPRL